MFADAYGREADGAAPGARVMLAETRSACSGPSKSAGASRGCAALCGSGTEDDGLERGANTLGWSTVPHLQSGVDVDFDGTAERRNGCGKHAHARSGVKRRKPCCGAGPGGLLTCTAPALFLLKKPPPLERVAKLGRDAATFSAAGASDETSSAEGLARDASAACMGLGAESKSGPGPTVSSCAGASNVDGE